MGLRYGQGKYGQFKYGRAESGFQFLAQISTSDGTIQSFLNNQIIDLSWEFNRIGGCGDFECTLKRSFDDLVGLTASNLKELYDFRIYITSGVGGSSTLYYRGYIKNIRPNLSDSEEVIISGAGYGDMLKSIIMHDGTGAPKEYTNKTISQVVTAIVNDFVTGNCPITAGDIDTYSTAVASIKFNDSVTEALDKLAEIVGADWGVDRDREIYFRTPSASAGFRWFIGKDIGLLEDEINYDDLINEVLIEGAYVDGVPYRYIQRNQASIDLFGLKQKRFNNSSIVSEEVAQKFASSILDRYHIYLRNMRINLPLNKTLIEETTPIPLVAIHKNPKQITYKYGTFKYGEQAYSGEQLHRIESISYQLMDLSIDTTIELNFGKPEITNEFNELDFKIEQQRQAQGV